MYTSSKIDVRMEAVRIAMQLKDVTADNVVRAARKIEAYILADTDLPEVGTDYYKSLLDSFAANTNKSYEPLCTAYQAEK